MGRLPERLAFLRQAENRDTFFRRIGLLFPISDPRYKAIERAYNTAKRAFRDEVREGGERYFEHLRAVTLILIDYLFVQDPELIIAALLHDIVEDIPEWTVERVRAEFGDRVAYLVDYLTKPPKEQYPETVSRDHAYHMRFEAAPREFFLIKLADRLHNLLTLDSCPPEKQERKITETRVHYLSYARKNWILAHELEDRLVELEKSAGK